MVTNDDGWVALKRYQTINKIVKVGGEEYLFFTKANICLAWIRPEHVESVLNIKKICCGGSRKHQFRYASDVDARRHTAGGGR